MWNRFTAKLLFVISHSIVFLYGIFNHNSEIACPNHALSFIFIGGLISITLSFFISIIKKIKHEDIDCRFRHAPELFSKITLILFHVFFFFSVLDHFQLVAV